MQCLNPYGRPSPHGSLSSGYPCDERKQIPLFRSTGAALRFPRWDRRRVAPFSTEWRNPMSKRGRPRKGEGAVYQRDDSQFWQVWYRDQKGEIVRESTSATDRQEAERFLRDRLDGRDEGRLPTVLNSKLLTFGQWAEWFLERRSKPPFRSEGNHQQNLNAMKFLRRGCTVGHHPWRRSRTTWQNAFDQDAEFTPSLACNSAGP